MSEHTDEGDAARLTDKEIELREWLRSQPGGAERWTVVKAGFRRSYDMGMRDSLNTRPDPDQDAASEEARRRFLTEPVVRARRAPVNGMPRGTISWSEHEKAWEAYHRRHSGQSVERIAERGGFGIEELTYQLGHLPTTWEPGPEALRQMEYFGVQPPRVTSPGEAER